MNTELFRPFKKQYSIHDVMEIIVHILNTRDPYTYEHSWRVSALSEKIVEKMNIEKRWVDVIHIAAHLHDIGKIGVPDNILNKPARLTDCEYEIIKSHSLIGYNIVNSLPQLNEIALYVKHHHERWDGRGYPEGLEKSEIPFGARVIAVADTFDAISSNRSYRRQRSCGEALEEIQKCSGTQLCPEVSEVFLSMENEIPLILNEVTREIEAKNII